MGLIYKCINPQCCGCDQVRAVDQEKDLEHCPSCVRAFKNGTYAFTCRYCNKKVSVSPVECDDCHQTIMENAGHHCKECNSHHPREWLRCTRCKVCMTLDTFYWGCDDELLNQMENDPGKCATCV